MDKQPTDVQAKEFWEWCGVPIYVRLIDGKWVNVLPIDLNNLFKYAVPKLLDRPFKGKILDMLLDWVYKIAIKKADPALALFWAIQQVFQHIEDKEAQYYRDEALFSDMPVPGDK